MNLREFHTIKNLFVILDGGLNLIYFNKLTKATVENIINNLEIQKCIKENNINNTGLKNYNFNINKYKVNNDYIFIIEIECDIAWNQRNNIDDITGLYNRNLWLDIINGKVPYFNLNDYSILQIVNIDNYKEIKHSYDSLSREKCIKEMSDIIKNNIDSEELAFRYKENEFIIISNINYANKIKEDISAINMLCDISIGSCEFNNKTILGQALTTASENKNIYIEKPRNSNIKHNNIKNEMEKLKDKLNLLMQNNYKNNYEKVLEVSIQLDNVINEYCMLERDR